MLRIATLFGTDEERADDRTNDACSCDDERHDDRVDVTAHHGIEAEPENHRTDHRADERLEEVGAHAGHVADVVTHVVCDDSGVTGIVLGKTRLDLADEVGADVRGLGVDATADSREERDRRGAHREAGEDVDRANELPAKHVGE